MRRKNRLDRGCIASYVGPRAYAPQTRAALEGLGYTVIPAFAMGRFDDPSWKPTLRLVDERQYEKIPNVESDPDTPVIVLTGARPRAIEDARIAGRTTRPAELRPLYSIIQQTLEETPRSAPRVPTLLSARCTRADCRWLGSVISLSERGCLFRGGEPIEGGTQMNLQFALPSNGIIITRAVCVRHWEGKTGFAFSQPSLEARRSISGFVTRRLATSRHLVGNGIALS